MKKLLALIFIMLLPTQLMAEPGAGKPLLDKQKFSVGAGISRNSVGPLDETGFQFFAGYDLDKVNLIEGAFTSIEIGYMDYGFSAVDTSGLWANVVIDGDIDEKFAWLARAGFDFGDDSGLMFGAGLGLNLNEKAVLRLEYVIRDDIDSIQFNLLYHM